MKDNYNAKNKRRNGSNQNVVKNEVNRMKLMNTYLPRRTHIKLDQRW